MLKYEVVEDKLCPGDWRAEAIDYESEGECYVVIFSGPKAEERAREYAEFKMNDLCTESHAHCSLHNTEDYCFNAGCSHEGNIKMITSLDLPAHIMKLHAFGHIYNVKIKDLPDPLTLNSITQFATELHQSIHKS